jgi:hypothetical protein
VVDLRCFRGKAKADDCALLRSVSDGLLKKGCNFGSFACDVVWFCVCA